MSQFYYICHLIKAFGFLARNGSKALDRKAAPSGGFAGSRRLAELFGAA